MARARQTRTGHRLVARIVTLLIVALAVSACVNVEFGSTFVADGGASQRMAIVFQRDLLDPTELARLTSAINDAEQRMADDGYEVQRVDSATQLGLRAARTSAVSSNVATELNSLLNSMLNRSDSSPIAPFQGTFSRSNPAVGGNKYHLELTFDGPTFKAAIEDLQPPSQQSQSPTALTDALTVTYTATMPGDLQDATGQTVAEGTARWTLSLDETTSITADSTVGKNTPWALAALAILIAVGIIVVSSVLITAILVVRRQAIERHIPTGLRIARDNPESVDAIDPPTEWKEIRASIRRSVRIALSGQRTSTIAPPDQPDAPEREVEHGPDTEGN
ncbi:MAG: hypothetical protein M9890_02665 [Thermomicrobiales bacterium]|nr:hypothetical protein [Thermomicrobiales bacterium]